MQKLVSSGFELPLAAASLGKHSAFRRCLLSYIAASLSRAEVIPCAGAVSLSIIPRNCCCLDLDSSCHISRSEICSLFYECAKGAELGESSEFSPVSAAEQEGVLATLMLSLCTVDNSETANFAEVAV